jgi:Zn-dependent protease
MSILKNLIIEDIDTVRRIPVGRFWGVTLSITPLSWLGPFVFFGLYFLLSLLNHHLSLGERIFQASIFAICAELATSIHSFGHIVSGKMVRGAMNELLIASTRDVNLYHGDQNAVPGHVHLVRSLGGPIMNLLAAGACYGLEQIMPSGFWSAFLARFLSVNLFVGLGSLLPLPSVDGEVIWREIFRSLRKARQETKRS